jgi:5-methyltetrahydrofolate--homocysteine methyltransferase
MRIDALYAALAERPLLFDGATGTYLERLAGPLEDAERNLLPLRRPELIARLHRDYLEAGADIVKTASFNANMIALGASAGATRELNRAAAGLARAEADRAMAAGGRARWVAGSVGPGSAAPSLGGPGYAELLASYLPQMEGLAEGGADLILIETAQDSIQIKAAIRAARLAEAGAGRRLPFIVSATLDDAGRLLSGASPEAFAAIVEPFRPLALGFNCSGGPEDLAAPFARLAGFASARLILMPNAGRPRRGADGSVRWPLGAEGYADACLEAAARHAPAFWGGCCGTGPEHIAALRLRVDGLGTPRPARERSFALASAFEAYRIEEEELFLIDERANASGSAAFKKLAAAADEEESLRFVLERASLPVAAVDINVAGRHERTLLPSLARRASVLAQAALSLDSLDAEALAEALPLAGGRPLVNSVNLEDRERALRLIDLAKEQGAALVCLSLDANGPARTADEKLRIAGELYELALARGLEPCDLLFDLCTFPAAAGGAASEGSAYETLAALPLLAARCPGSRAILGVGNSSFGLPKSLRAGFTAAFMAKARAAGLAAAIVDYAAARLALEPLHPLSSAREASRDGTRRGSPASWQERMDQAAAPFFEAGPPPDGALEALLALAESALGASAVGKDAGGAEAGGGSVALNEAERAVLPPLAAMADGIARAARTAAIQGLGRAVAEGGARTELASAIAAAMSELGRRYDRGGLALPLVLRSADVARACFDELKALLPDTTGGAAAARPLVVLSTVKGDLHDIGKNLVAMVLESAGYEVLDLGTDKPADAIALAAAEVKAVAVGVSGLLTRSLDEMEALTALLARQGSSALLLCGGAAVEEDFVRGRLEALRPGLVRYGRDPFAALDSLRDFLATPQAGTLAESVSMAKTGSMAKASETILPAAAVEYRTPPAGGAPAPASQGSPASSAAQSPAAQAGARYFSLDALLARLDKPTLAQARLGYTRAERDGAYELLDSALVALRERGGIRATCLCSWFKAGKLGGDRLELRDEARGATGLFAFPREQSGQRRSVYDYYEDDGWAPAFCLTLGQEASVWLKSLRLGGDSGLYLAAHALLAGLAEAAAVLAHADIAGELSLRGLDSPGKRYSFGYPACPGVEANAPLLSLLGASAIGLYANAEHQLVPEFSVSAIVVPNNAARYFTLAERGRIHG